MQVKLQDEQINTSKLRMQLEKAEQDFLNAKSQLESLKDSASFDSQSMTAVLGELDKERALNATLTSQLEDCNSKVRAQ